MKLNVEEFLVKPPCETCTGYDKEAKGKLVVPGHLEMTIKAHVQARIEAPIKVLNTCTHQY